MRLTGKPVILLAGCFISYSFCASRWKVGWSKYQACKPLHQDIKLDLKFKTLLTNKQTKQKKQDTLAGNHKCTTYIYIFRIQSNTSKNHLSNVLKEETDNKHKIISKIKTIVFFPVNANEKYSGYLKYLLCLTIYFNTSLYYFTQLSSYYKKSLSS